MQARALECGFTSDCLHNMQDYVELSGGEWISNMEYLTDNFQYDTDFELCAYNNNYTICWGDGESWEGIATSPAKQCEAYSPLYCRVCKSLGSEYTIYSCD